MLEKEHATQVKYRKRIKRTINQLTKKNYRRNYRWKMKPGKRQGNNGVGYIICGEHFGEGFSVPDVHTKTVLNLENLLIAMFEVL